MKPIDLTVAIATTQARLHNVAESELPIIDGVVWKIYVQGVEDTVAFERCSNRKDVSFVFVLGQGASANRNAAIQDATILSELLLFSDDDITHNAEGIRSLLQTFAQHPEIDILCARLNDENGRLRKRYSRHKNRLTWYNSAKIGTPELAIRLKPVRTSGVMFDEAFGAGKTAWFGDEFIFICDALRAGLKGMHVNILLGAHPDESSGIVSSTAKDVVRVMILKRALGFWKSSLARGYYFLRSRLG